MNFSKSKVAVAFGAALGLGMVGQASAANVYGLSTLQIDSLVITTDAIASGAGLYTFDSNQDAILNDIDDPVDGAANCVGIFPSSGNCNVGVPTLSGIAQNAPPNTAATSRGENDYRQFGQNGNYSNSESGVLISSLTGAPGTSLSSISESNLASTGTAQSNTNLGSSTNLDLRFDSFGLGGINVDFDAFIALQTEVSGLSGGEQGIAQAATGATFLLQLGGATLVSWAPTGNNNVSFCAAGLSCVASETALSLNNTSASNGANNTVLGTGRYSLHVDGLTDSTSANPYTFAFNTTTSTNVTNLSEVPLPAAAWLFGSALLGLGLVKRRHT